MNDLKQRKELLKHLILQLHKGEAPEQVRAKLIEVLREVPYDDVVEVEEKLIEEGLPKEEILKLCDIHTQVLDGHIDTSRAKKTPAGHPVDTFKQENREIEKRVKKFKELFEDLENIKDDVFKDYMYSVKALLNELSDIDKHYKRKEYLLFPFLEKAGIKGPPIVMWGKHDETREFLKTAHQSLESIALNKDEFKNKVIPAINTVLDAITGMIMKEEEILLPMSTDTLKEEEWLQIYNETLEFGYCLYDPKVEWKPENAKIEKVENVDGSAIRLSTGNFDVKELEALFATLPIDITFVDKDDKVRFFSHSPKRVFERNRSVIGRDVRMCHPPHSVDVVEQILRDFKSGKEDKAAFWIENFKGSFIYIDYTALRGEDGEYLGVVETTQDITELRSITGNKRLLSYSEK